MKKKLFSYSVMLFTLMSITFICCSCDKETSNEEFKERYFYYEGLAFVANNVNGECDLLLAYMPINDPMVIPITIHLYTDYHMDLINALPNVNLPKVSGIYSLPAIYVKVETTNENGIITNNNGIEYAKISDTEFIEILSDEPFSMNVELRYWNESGVNHWEINSNLGN